MISSAMMNSERRTVLRPGFTLAAVVIAMRISNNVVDAQLLGCDAVNCPQNQQNPLQSLCNLDGIANIEIGITNFTSAISPEPLTWTVGVSGLPDFANSTEQIWSRNFYLGTPPALNMTDLNTITGCALFFEGISSSLRFPGSNIDTSIGSCNDALSAACVTDLMSQANSSLLQLTQSTQNVCEGLEAALRNSAPKSCKITQDGAWGSITAKGM
jgi:hypothetical protein